VGKAADLVAVDLSDVGTTPVHNVISHLVYVVGRHQVSDVWVAGQPVVQNGQVTTLDVAAILEKAQTWADKMHA
jgi:5-methylthioadenosine/S-adenosylhomocysteine deaminase